MGQTEIVSGDGCVCQSQVQRPSAVGIHEVEVREDSTEGVVSKAYEGARDELGDDGLGQHSSYAPMHITRRCIHHFSVGTIQAGMEKMILESALNRAAEVREMCLCLPLPSHSSCRLKKRPKPCRHKGER